MKDTETTAAPQTARKKKPYVRPTCIVVPVQIEARLLGASTQLKSRHYYHIGDEQDNPPHLHDNIYVPDAAPTVTSKFKNGYWVDDDEEDW